MTVIVLARSAVAPGSRLPVDNFRVRAPMVGGVHRLDVALGSRLIPFQEGWELQRRIHEEVVGERRPSTLIMLEHEPVYTVGRRAHSWERPDSGFVEPGHVPVVDVDRGGKTTWHGPGQLTVYPIVRLASPSDVIQYVRALEAAVIEVCADYGLAAIRVEGRSGVWIGAEPDSPSPFRAVERKICALGVRVARGVTMHGIGLNVNPDLTAFSLDRIVPCGIDDAGVTSLVVETGQRLRAADVADDVAAALAAHLTPLVAQDTPIHSA